MTSTTQNPHCELSLTPDGTLTLHTTLRDGTDYQHELPKGKAEQILRQILEAQRQSPAIGQKAGSTAIALGQILAHIAAFGTTTPQALEAKRLETKATPEELGL